MLALSKAGRVLVKPIHLVREGSFLSGLQPRLSGCCSCMAGLRPDVTGASFCVTFALPTWSGKQVAQGVSRMN